MTARLPLHRTPSTTAPSTPSPRRLRLLVALLVVATALTLTPTDASAASFRDVGFDHAFRSDIDLIAREGITKGCNKARTKFCPDSIVSRGEMAAFLTRMLDLPAGTTRFRDARGHLFEREISALARAGITSGCARTRFCPDAPVTREQMASFLTAALDLPAGEHRFRDVPRRSTHTKSINAVAAARITQGCNEAGTRFCPADNVTRGQMAAFLARSLRYLGRVASTPQWLRTLPTSDQVGNKWTADPGTYYGLRAKRNVDGVRAVGGRDAAIIAWKDDIRITNSLLGGAADGLKANDGTTLRNSVVSMRYSNGKHLDNVQIRGDDGVTLERLRLIAQDTSGKGSGWNAAIFVHEGSTDWTVRHVLVEAGRGDGALRSWYPVRFETGRGIVDGLVVDRATMRGKTAVQVKSGVEIVRWRDVYIRERDGSLTPVPNPQR